MAEALLRAVGLGKRFGATVALEGLDLDVAPGEFLALLGGSGSGKSTLLRLIAGFEAPDAGRLTLDGRDLAGVPPHARPVGMMFQSYALFPHLSVADNVGYGPRRDGLPRAEVARRVAEALALVRLEGFGPRRPHQLSGGQRQRVALARALVRRPRLLLLDEPLGALDAGLRERTGFELRAVQRAKGAALVLVTHDQAEALALADRIGVLAGGRLAQVGPPAALWERPASRVVAEFLGGANVLAADDAAVGCALVGLAPAAAYALRPERAVLLDAAPGAWPEGAGPGRNVAPGTVEEVAYRGDTLGCLVRLDAGATLRVSRASTAAGAVPERGARVTVAWPAAALVPLAE